MGSLLAIYDPSGKLGLTDPSPGGGKVPTLIRLESGEWSNRPSDEWRDLGAWLRAPHALLLVTEDGTPDPVGMARAREVLALSHPCLHTPEDVARGVWFFRGYVQNMGDAWIVQTPSERTAFGVPDPTESAPEALARLLSEHAGVEVIRG